MIDKNTGQAVTDCPVYQHCRHGGIHPAGKRTKHPALAANTLANLFYRALYKPGTCPVACATAHVIQKCMQQLGTKHSVLYFRVKLHPVQFFRFVFHRRDRASVAGGRHLKARRYRVNLVAMSHPADTIFYNTAHQATGRFHLYTAIFTRHRGNDFTAQQCCH
ncbi:hypothetical protein SDC9_173484 [bioreactor metagenome]|uniref:Uncharacterized protein n=1 Tax=bioreactor metagenome TaxID=1076179 RepID=A0A645GJK1_9ZZZZ